MAKRILVIGLGPAGAASAIFLAGAGHAVTALDKSSGRGLRIGESLPPDAAKVLRDLGIWEAFQSGPHLPCFGNQSAWGSLDLHYNDFITHLNGQGWHLDRAAFEGMLVEEAKRRGAEVQWGRKLKGAVWEEGKWKVGIEGEGEREFDFVVDATGRNAWFARRQGVDRLYEDQQLALVAFLGYGKAANYTASLIEAVEWGWWYSAPVPGGRMATAFMCAPTKEQRVEWLEEGAWWGLANSAPHTFARLRETESTWLARPHFVSADSGILERICGEGWLAVGDAAMAYDPIASHGIQMSLVAAREAASAITAHFSGTSEALPAYQQRMFQSYQHYTEERRKFYRSETRFPHSPYWQDRL